MTIPLRGQNESFCGVLPPHTATSTNPDSIVYDRFGNSYDLSYFQSNTSEFSQGGCNSGYFDLVFTGIDPTWQSTICKVFEDISNIILQRYNTNACGDEVPSENVRIRITADPIGNANVGAQATPYFISVNSFNSCSSVLQNRAYIRINGGQLDDTDDGMLNISPDFPWHLDWTTPVQPGLNDMYSIVLHEVLHLIAFHSLIGIIESDNYSLWDQYIYLTDEYISTGGSQNIIPLIESDNVNNCWELNQNIPNWQDLIDIATENCSVIGTYDIVFGINAIAPILGTEGVLPTTNSEMLNALSHLSNTCNGLNEEYVMSPGLQTGEANRDLSEDELSILCQLGYNINNFCDECYLVVDAYEYHPSVNVTYFESCCAKDYYACVGTNISIPFEELLCNDISNDDLVITNYFVHPSQAFNLTVTNTGTSFQVSASQAGTYTIYYSILGCDSRIFNARFDIVIGTCVDCIDLDPCDNLTCLKGFEDFLPANITGSNTAIVYELSGYWVYETSNQNSPDICEESNGNNFLQMYSNSASLIESVAIRLQEPIEPGCGINVLLKASTRVSNTQLLFYGSENGPCHPADALISLGCTPTICETYLYNPVCIISLDITNVAIGDFCPVNADFTSYSFNWTNNNLFPIQYLILTPQPEPQEWSLIHIDDLVVTKSCTDACFYLEFDCPVVTLTPCYPISSQTHLWDFGDNSTSTDENLVHTYTSSGTFVITHTVTDECGNTESSTQSVVIDIPVAAFTFALTTCPSYQFTNTSDGSNLQFAWDFGNGNTSTDENPTFAFAANSSYTVTLTVSNDCGSSTATQTLIVDCIEEACSCPTGLTAYIVGTQGNPTLEINVTTSVLPALVVTNSCIQIYSNLIINQNYEISNCNLIMHPGSSITINTDIRLKSIGNEYAGCEVMWKGIIMEPSANLRFESNTIQDAQYAISVNNKAVVRLVNNTFRKNYIGVYDPVTGCPWFDLTRFSGNNFNCTDVTLLLPFSGQTPLPGDISYAGVSLNNLNMVDFGNVAFPLFNSFNDISNGFVAENASFGVSQARFNRIQPNSDYAISGYGIHAVGTSDNTLIQRGEDIISGTASFSRVWNPIYTEGMGCDIMNNHITKSFNGVDIRLTAECNVNVSMNKIESDNVGIHGWQNNGSLSFAIEDNYVCIDSFNTESAVSGIGIFLNGGNTSFNPPAQINRNYTNLYKNNDGIVLNSTNNARIYDNVVNLRVPNLNWGGIFISGSADCELQCNHIESINSTTVGKNVGIWSSICSNCRYKSNTMRRNYWGLHFDGVCPGTDIETNILERNTIGLHLTQAGRIGPQPGSSADDLKGNRWTDHTDLLPKRAVWEGSHLFQELLENQIGVNSNDPPTVPTNVMPATGWFTSSINPTIPYDANLCLPYEPLMAEALNSEDFAIAGDLSSGNSIEESMDYIAKRYLYGKLDENPELIDMNTLIEAFWIDASNGTLSELYGVEKDKNMLYALEEAIRSLITGNIDQIKIFAEQIAAINSALPEDPTEVEIAAAALQKEPIYLQLALLSDQHKVIVEGVKADRSDEADYVKGENDIITSNENYEVNEKIVNDIFLNTIAKGVSDFNLEQVSALEYIAHQCPLTGGIGVIQARSLYSSIEMKRYDDQALCAAIYNLIAQVGDDRPLQGHYQDTGKQKNSDETAIKSVLIPNPAHDKAVCYYQLETEGEIVVANILGKTMTQTHLQGGYHQIELNTAPFPSGIYTVTIFNAQGSVVSNHQLIIIH